MKFIPILVLSLAACLPATAATAPQRTLVRTDDGLEYAAVRQAYATVISALEPRAAERRQDVDLFNRLEITIPLGGNEWDLLIEASKTQALASLSAKDQFGKSWKLTVSRADSFKSPLARAAKLPEGCGYSIRPEFAGYELEPALDQRGGARPPSAQAVPQGRWRRILDKIKEPPF